MTTASTPARLRVALGADEAAVELKAIIRTLLQEEHSDTVEVLDHGIEAGQSVDYPDVALDVASAVAAGEADRAILMCGTGIGMAITANKVPGIRAAQAHDVYSAERARKSNDAQILTLGALVIGPELAKSIVEAWLISEFAGGRSAPKVAKIAAVEARFHPAGEPA